MTKAWFDTVKCKSMLRLLKINKGLIHFRTIMTNTHLGFIPPPTFSNPGAKQRLAIPKLSGHDSIPEMIHINGNVHAPIYQDISQEGLWSQNTNKLTTHANVERDDIVSTEIDYPFADVSEEDLTTVYENGGPNPKIKTRPVTADQNTMKPLMGKTKQHSGLRYRDNYHETSLSSRHPNHRATNRGKGNSDNAFINNRDNTVTPHGHPKTSSENETPNESGYIVRLMEPYINERCFSVPDVFPFPEDQPVHLSKTIASDDDQLHGYYWESGLPQQKKCRRKNKKKKFHSHMLQSDTQTFLTEPRDYPSETVSSARESPPRNTNLVPVLNVAYFRQSQNDDTDGFKENFLLLDKYTRQAPNGDAMDLETSHKSQS